MGDVTPTKRYYMYTTPITTNTTIQCKGIMETFSNRKYLKLL